MLIFDCCFAGRIVANESRAGTRERNIEVLGAASADGLTAIPGKNSFTHALIWALQKLAKEGKGFTTSRLYNEILSAPHFPLEEQSPFLSTRSQHIAKRIVLEPLVPDRHRNPLGLANDSQNFRESSRYSITLDFLFPACPSRSEIENLAEHMKELIRADGLKVTDIVWGGLKKRLEEKVPLLVQSIAYHWLALAQRRKKTSPKHVKWASVLGKRHANEFSSNDLEQYKNLQSSSKRARSGSAFSSVPTPSPTPSPPVSSDPLKLEHPSSAMPIDVEMEVNERESESAEFLSVAADPSNHATQPSGFMDVAATKLFNEQVNYYCEYYQRRSAIRLFRQQENGLSAQQAPEIPDYIFRDLDPDMQGATTSILGQCEAYEKAVADAKQLPLIWVLLSFYCSVLISYGNIHQLQQKIPKSDKLTFLAVKEHRPQVAELISFDFSVVKNLLEQTALCFADPAVRQVPSGNGDHLSGILTVRGVAETFVREAGLECFLGAPDTAVTYLEVADMLQAIAQFIDLVGISSMEGHIGLTWKSIQDLQHGDKSGLFWLFE